MSTMVSPSKSPQPRFRAAKSCPVIVASDGSGQSDPALVTGRILAGDANQALRVVSVIRPMPIVTPDSGLLVTPEVEASRRADQKRMVVEQMRRLWRDGASVDAEVYDGDAASAIASLAHEANASLIVAGLGRHRVIDRLFGDETALRLIRVSAAPVLAVAPGLTHAPRRIVVAIDFSETSVRAARLALELAAPGATVYLAHVAPRDSTLNDWNGNGTDYKVDAGDALQRAREQLDAPNDVSMQTILLYGDPATELLALAASVGADLIASGSHGHGFVTRLLIGSVTTRLLRCSTCSVLCMPHHAATTRVRATCTPPVVTPMLRSQWSADLDEFSRRNIGRRGILEVDDPEIGAQAQEHDYPLLGATFDPYDQRVELMLGELGDVRRHLTRSIGSVSGIDVLKDEHGRDIALRIAHGVGQTLLTFAR
jgi:nucleotide-binding universal stress UspA family protein